MRIAILLALVWSALAAADQAPDAKEARAQIDKLVAAAGDAKRPATLGLLRDVIDLTQGYGGKAFDAGDHGACERFYYATTVQLTRAFSGEGKASPLAAAALKDLAAALERAKALKDADRQAWTMRLGFDQLVIACQAEQTRGQLLLQEGTGFMGRQQYEEADIAYRLVCELGDELRCENLANVAVTVRAGPLLRAQSLLMLHHDAEAAAGAAKAMEQLPDLPKSDLDFRKIIPAPVLTLLVDEARTYAKAHEKDADAQFLLGFEQRYAGDATAAAPAFAAALAIDSGHVGAKLLAGDAPPKPQ
jgi:hypothetical protein